MNKSLRAPTVISNMLLLLGLIAIWVAFAPTSIGGRVSYVMVNGISMEPDFHLGDLAVLRDTSEYQVGDIVTYYDAQMQAYVIHRIIGIDQNRFILKGDNNSWIDAYRPIPEEIVGKLWIHIPKLGKVFKWVRSPLNLALTIGLLGGALMINMLKPNRQRKGNLTSGNFAGVPEGELTLFGFLAVIFLGLGIFAFVNPLTRAADKIQYLQESHFSYSAAGAPVIYDTNVVRSGEPIFPRLTCFLNIDFAYNVVGDQLQGVSGVHQVLAKVMDEQSGWQRTISMTQPSAFNGNAFSTASTLDLCQIAALVNTLEQETGLRANTYTLEIISQVAMTATIEGNQITDSFEPKLVLRFDQVHFFLSTPNGQDDPLSLSQQSSVPTPKMAVNTLSILGFKPTVMTIRVIALLGLAISLIVLLSIGQRVLGTAQQSPVAMIRLRYGALLVNIYEGDLGPASRVIDVTTIDELAKLAERHNTVILHMTLNFLHWYLVQSNEITYRFILSAGKRNVPAIQAASNEMVAYAFDVNQTQLVKSSTVEEDSIGYVLHNRRSAHGEPEETVILGKIRL